MLLRRMKAVGLRSIDKAELESCGRFNILIGKNNAGKSNILSAILGFFNTIRSGDIINLRPDFNHEDDFYDRNTRKPTEITCTFEMQAERIARLLTSISNEFPSVSNAMSQIQQARFLKATTKHFLKPSPFGVLTKIGLGEADDEMHKDSYVTIFEISDDLAPQILERFQEASQKQDQLNNFTRVLSNVDSDDFGRFKSPERAGVPLRYFLDRGSPGPLNPQVLQAIEQYVGQAGSFSDFQQLLRSKIIEIEKDISDIEKAPIAGSIYTFSGHQHLIPKYVTEICAFFASVKVLHQSERREPISKGDAQRLLSLRVRKGGDKLFQTFKASVAALIGVEVDAFEDSVPSAPGRRTTPAREAKLDVDNFIVQANGSGVREALRLMLDIELDEPDIMLIEEPEIHLHPALETSVMRYLKRKSDKSQIFLTTHSTNFIDSGEYSAIHFVRKAPSTTSRLLTAEQAADVLPEELGLRLSSLFMYEKLVFVEGSSDEDVLREWASSLGFNFSQANVGFITMGGSRNIKHFAAAKTTEFLNSRGVELWFLLDRDESAVEDMTKLQAALGSNCILRTLNAREIENYLAKPCALSQYISQRLAQSGGELLASPSRASISVVEISRAIDECANGLRDFAFGKSLLRRINNPIYVSPQFTPSSNQNDILNVVKKCLGEGSATLLQRQAALEGMISSFTTEFDAAWEQNKLLIVPGTELLEAVLRPYGLAYKKQRDAKGIAALMEPSEIPQDVSDLIREIAPPL